MIYSDPNQIQQRLAAIVESSDDVIVSKTRDGTITSWNRGAERILGYTAQEAIGNHISMLVPAERAHDTAKILSSVQRGERIDHLCSQRRGKDGSIVDICLTVSPIRNEKGEVIGAVKVGRHIASQKLHTTEFPKSNRRHEEFLDRPAHVPRNPIAAIRGAVQFLDELATRSELTWTKDIIQRQIRNLSQLSDDLVEVSPNTGDSVELRKQPVERSTLAASARENVRPQIEDRKHEVSVAPPPSELRIDAEGLGKRSEFTVHLPFVHEDREISTDRTGNFRHRTRSQRGVLVFDGNRDTASELARMLTLFGHIVQTANDSQTAIKIAIRSRPAVLLVDLGLPGLGYEVIRRLHAEDLCRDAVFVAISIDGSDHALPKSIEVGFDHHLVKPVDYQSILQVLADYCESDDRTPNYQSV